MISHPKLAELTKQFHADISITKTKHQRLHYEESRSYQNRFDKELGCMVQIFVEKGNPFNDTSGRLLTMCTKEMADDEGVQQLMNLKSCAAKKYKMSLLLHLLKEMHVCGIR